ncbi:c-type cytochrome domain-containing protein [Phaeodactylibacter luteus]|uniref:Cytochrome c domain-containing protein n=1 Tax=Phaeodactylibacter luteus TaxID=1564516 RepID=A0A5C6RK51_9BACT|nr:c-type cytochrome domain-containing protein [Phaeodactylibacter luteus]TXB62285.1 hypothetical protein FRY97_14645 [Phaeodactylibacter luteus]
MIKKMFYSILCTAVLCGCSAEYLQPVSGVCFESEVLPIFVSNCTQSGCHNSIDREEGYDLTAYEQIVRKGIVPGDFRASEVYNVLLEPLGEERMPPAPNRMLSATDIQTIALWIEEGARNTTCEPADCSTAAVSFAQDIQPIMASWCNGCHSTGAPSAGVVTSTYTGMKTIADNGSLAGTVAHEQGYPPMPDNGGQLSACEIALIRQWVADGAPNN